MTLRLERLRRVWLRITLVLIVGVVLIPIVWLAGLRLVISGSVPPGVWWIHNGAINRSQYVMVCLPLRVAEAGRKRGYLPSGICPGHVLPQMKHIIGVPGDRIELSENGVAVNGVRLPRSGVLRRDHDGQSIPRLVDYGRYLVGPGELWVLGDSSKSWDSRYFGAVRSSSVLGVGTPILVRPADG